MRKALVSTIRFYQYVSRTLFNNGQLPLLIHSDCKFYPTCSDYAIESINKYGAAKGSARALIRIIKCNPLSKGGINNP